MLEQEATYPRVIIDPSIIKMVAEDKVGFLKQLNGSMEYTFENRLINSKNVFSKIGEDGIFVDYGNKQ